jgi:FkbM family methyltransferase
MSFDALRKNRAIRRTYRLFRPFVLFLNEGKAFFKRAIIAKNVEALLVNSSQGLFLVAPEDLGVGRSLIERGGYGHDEIQRINCLTNENSAVLFVGTHIGALAIPVSRKVKHVTAIEANPDTFTLLTRNILLNNSTNISAIQLAASDQPGELEFLLSRANSGGSKRMPVTRAYNYFYDRPKIIKVRADRLDTIVPDGHDVIVMDIEGSEYFALKGMERLLSEAHHLIVEFMPDHLKNVSNVSVKQFLALVEPHFESLSIPSKQLVLERPQFLSVLEEMYRLDETDDGIVFSKKLDRQ